MADFIEEKEWRILILEDVPSDADLEEFELRDAGLVFTALRVDTRAAFEQALDEFKPDIVLADVHLPTYSGRDALEYTRRTHPQIPVILATGALGDEAAVEMLKLGAKDYVLKDRLARLAPAIKRALHDEMGVRNRKLAEGKYKALFSAAMDGIALIDGETWRITDCNPEFQKQSGRTMEQIKELTLFDLLPPEQREPIRQSLLEIQQAESGRGGVFTIRRPDGKLVSIEFSAKFMDFQQQRFIQCITRDITERKQAERVLQRANRALKTLSASNAALVRATDEPELLGAVCRVVVEQGGYRMAWVGYADDNLERSITPKAWAGVEDGTIFGLKLSWADTERGQATMSRAIRSGEPQTTHDILSDPGCEPCRELAIAQGFISVFAYPLRVGNRIIGSIGIYAGEAEAFDVEERALLEDLANNLAFGIESLRTRADRDHMTDAHVRDAERLQKSLVQSIQTIADTVEARDPYTAGHQRRVSALAAAIAQELGLTEEVIHGIRLAATIHDLGKIQVPAEILVKPGKLSDIEFMLMKVHPQAGYDILKNVDFPWPIAAMVYQHHERLDGSGYPQGLKGEEILFESRIMAVADVVEAIASHRPYRPSLGIEAALAEIESGRGSAYDPAVVDACLKLFREGRFAFKAETG